MKASPTLTLMVLLAGATVPALAVEDKYGITPMEHAACDGDVERLCAAAFPDQDKVMTCMREKRAELSDVCLTAFEAGMKRRHLPL